MDAPVSGRLGTQLHPAANIGRFAKYGLAAIGLLFGGFFLWAAFAPLSGAIIASGFVKVDLNRKTVQHLEGGIVKEILVRDGDTVQAGQTLIIVQDERVSASVDLIEGQWLAELAKAARLQAQREGADTITYPDVLMQRSTEDQVADVIRGETVYFDTKRQALDDQIRLLEQQIAQARDEVEARRERMASEVKAADYLREEVEANEQLVLQNNVAKVQLLNLRRQFEEYEARRGEQQAEMANTRQKMTDLELKIVSLKNEYTEAAANELTDVRANIYDLEERLRPSLDAKQRQQIVAPIAGTVINLKVFTVGGVIGPREPILDIVPLNNVMVIEARLPVDGIDDVHMGQIADIRLSAYKMRTTPLISGQLTYIAADRLMDEKTGEPYYLALIEVDRESMKVAPELQLYPGMPAEVFIRTGERTALDYLLAPIESTLRRSLREQ